VRSLRNKRIANGKRPLTRSEIMGRVKARDSEAEVALRSALHARGIRFRLQRLVQGIRADIVFPGARVVVFVDGCFWHGCPIHASLPRSNQSYWAPKLARNRERDSEQSALLAASGWTVVRVWEHDCLPPHPTVVENVANLVRQGRQGMQ